MPRRHQQNATIFNAGTIVNVLTIPILTAAVYFVGNYYTTGFRLSVVEIAVKNHESDLKAEAAERQKNRDEYLDKLSKMSDGIAQLNTQTEVSKTEQKRMNDQLSKVVEVLQQINVSADNARRR